MPDGAGKSLEDRLRDREITMEEYLVLKGGAGAGAGAIDDLNDQQFRALLRAITSRDQPMGLAALIPLLRIGPGTDELGRAGMGEEGLTPRSRIILEFFTAMEAARRNEQERGDALAETQRRLDQIDAQLAQRQKEFRVSSAADQGRLSTEIARLQQERNEWVDTVELRRQELGQQRKRDIEDLGLERERLAQQGEQAGLDRLLQQELLETRLDFERVEGIEERGLRREEGAAERALRERETQLGAQLQVFRGAIDQPYAFAALQALASRAQQESLEQQAAEQFTQQQTAFQQAQQTFQKQEAERQQIEQELAQLEANFQIYQTSPMAQLPTAAPIVARFFAEIDARKKALASLQRSIAPTAPQLPAIPGRQQGPFEMEAARAFQGFQVPGLQQSNIPGIFGGRIPTVGSFAQLTPETRQFLQALTGFSNISPGQFEQQSRGVTPMPFGLRQLMPALR